MSLLNNKESLMETKRTKLLISSEDNTTKEKKKGFIIGSCGVKVDEEKVKVIQDRPTPKTMSEILNENFFKPYMRRNVYHICERTLNPSGPMSSQSKKRLTSRLARLQRPKLGPRGEKSQTSPLMKEAYADSVYFHRERSPKF
ncbi:hypothetical protein CR513_28102, partial [Mucuna pruriens]